MNLAFFAVAALAATPPHLLLINIDDLGHTDVNYLGAEFATPNIDELAKAGMRLNHYYVQPTCTPTRASILTGLVFKQTLSIFFIFIFLNAAFLTW
jgi:arylsulfatase A-like enzyme